MEQTLCLPLGTTTWSRAEDALERGPGSQEYRGTGIAAQGIWAGPMFPCVCVCVWGRGHSWDWAEGISAIQAASHMPPPQTTQGRCKPSPNHQRLTLGGRQNPELHKPGAIWLKIESKWRHNRSSFFHAWAEGWDSHLPHIWEKVVVPGTDFAVCRACWILLERPALVG